MFDFLKKDMTAALTSLSTSLPNNTHEFTPDENQRLLESPLFKAIDAAYAEHDLSSYGGLAWFMNQSISLTNNEMQNGKKLSTSSQKIFYKLSHYAVVLQKHSGDLRTLKSDATVIEQAARTANKFVELSIETQTC